MDVSTEGKNAHALTFVRYLHENAIHEDILYCLQLPEHETAQSMFAVLQRFMEERQLPWDRMVGFCRRSSVNGRQAGLRMLIMDVSPSAILYDTPRATGSKGTERGPRRCITAVHCGAAFLSANSEMLLEAEEETPRRGHRSIIFILCFLGTKVRNHDQPSQIL
ncbi:hypothetical protein NHX12_004514 [Muraenolepis orangiensis]|uniref:Uncharacterized protein n=1 Tax=Muraenolepis orangiensis TaxID=630683 RepID=A0A9Q0IEC0_9TELE|nr:hypothetical protein NHX12_004514 [Muraenolepis orangiensis]